MQGKRTRKLKKGNKEDKTKQVTELDLTKYSTEGIQDISKCIPEGKLDLRVYAEGCEKGKD